MKPLPRTYDALFEAHLSVPIEYARALAWMESGMNPRNKTGDYWGLFQVGPENLADYNKAHPAAQFTRDQLLDPAVNVKVWSWEAERIRDALVGAGLVEDWTSRDWVSLFTAGWNSGYSRTAGVAYMLSWLAAHHLPLTHDNVFMHAKKAGATWALQQQHSHGGRKYRWQRDVAAVYAAESAAAGDAAILANLAHWATKRIAADQLVPPDKASSSSAVAASTTPLPSPLRAQGATDGSGAGWLLVVAVLLLALGKDRRR